MLNKKMLLLGGRKLIPQKTVVFGFTMERPRQLMIMGMSQSLRSKL